MVHMRVADMAADGRGCGMHARELLGSHHVSVGPRGPWDQRLPFGGCA